MHVINVNCQVHVHTFRKFSFIRLVSLFFLQPFEIMIIKISVSFLYSISFSRFAVVMCYTGFFSSVNLKWDKNKEAAAYLYNIHCASLRRFKTLMSLYFDYGKCSNIFLRSPSSKFNSYIKEPKSIFTFFLSCSSFDVRTYKFGS